MPRWSVGARLLMAIVIEGGWEIFENTEFTINRYRETTIALDYYGDSVLNSVADILAMVAGFLIAAAAPVWTVVVAAVLLEIRRGLHDPRQSDSQCDHADLAARSDQDLANRGLGHRP